MSDYEFLDHLTILANRGITPDNETKDIAKDYLEDSERLAVIKLLEKTLEVLKCIDKNILSFIKKNKKDFTKF
jgi:murein L,D-transpeptidase YafK